ncbi:MAG: glycosyltransferase family 4 protein [Syntrophales bacterium]|nr:glycosyltransferase family 4 protein [Syntrophales bacterium]
MRVLMFGWEFPPVVSGGLGTACYEITKALTGLGDPVLFVMPRIELSRPFPLLTLISASDILNAASETKGPFAQDSLLPPSPNPSLLPPYLRGPIILRPYLKAGQSVGGHQGRRDWPADSYLAAGEGYGVDLFAEVRRYGEAGGLIAARETFDIIHGHDWMTVPACLAARQASGKPFILHIHSLEYDRSGEEINESIFELERFGLEAADKIIAVSHYTKKMIVSRYGIAPGKIFVVYNAMSQREAGKTYRTLRTGNDKVVLFMGRITFQKGPEYFIDAAARVLKEMPEVTFIMAGSGDMMPRMVERVAELKIGKRFHFTGFLQGRQVEEAFAGADLYVMPSVSEPFGLAPLEAMMYDVPVIISRQSGVSEVLKHALKVDFWDVDELANKMIAVLKYPPLTGELVERAREELKNLRWEKAALKILEVYKV